ncbi:C6 transcription factor [Metarhizium acridum CQMa 102]|uniref:C6 transcription factor n=1 Tax=Metarhizium acridum (strain CQMa 102) TaxID=655827 RepID=E9E6F9_METAQ|nr:C6 transcription factor [Metarhizium acridum CQMa 102]EFY88563.1 C6 transcription factor [Metarhizium acridum CQMa 102]
MPLQAETRRARRTPNAQIPRRPTEASTKATAVAFDYQVFGAASVYTESARTVFDHRVIATSGVRQDAAGSARRPQYGCRHLTSPMSMSGGQSSLQAEECPDVAIQPQSEPQSEPEFRLRTDPFVIPSRTIPNFQRNRRQWIWLSPWSTWSFTVRLMLTLGEKLRPGSPSLPQNVLETEVYEFPWPSFSSSEMNISGLPSLNHALYLFTTVKFHLGQTYRLFDEEEFESEIRDFYANAVQNVSHYRVWFIKFLLVLAFGTAFHTSHTTAQQPPGAQFFSRAMALMPGPGCHSPLCYGDSGNTVSNGLPSYQLSNAIRIAQMEGLHTQLPQEELGAEKVTYCRDLWWTLYIMDRHFSSSLGLPMSVQDGDITTPVNPPNCVIFATRPPLLAALKERSELLGHPDDENWDSFLAQTATVISAGIKSAAKTLQILSKEYSLLDARSGDTFGKHIGLGLMEGSNLSCQFSARNPVCFIVAASEGSRVIRKIYGQAS